MSRRAWGWTVAAVSALGLAVWGIRLQANRRPNVVILVVDTLRRDHVGLYGYERNTTPRLDEFFEKGTTYEGAITSAPCTVPAVKQLLTGALDFDDRRPRLAEVLRQAGYATAAVVSQHHFRTPTGPLPQYSRGFDVFDVQSEDQEDQHGMTSRDATEVTARALHWLDSRPRDQPFFLWLHYFDPHDPYESPGQYRIFDAPDSSIGGDRRTYLQQAMAQALATADESERKEILRRTNPYAHFGAVFTRDQVATLRSYYDAEILYADEQIGRVLARLAEEGLLANTLVFLTSDHGERLGEDNRWAHCQSLHGYEIDVPLAIFPRIGNRPRAKEAASTLDIMPTVLEAAGIEFEGTSFDGQSLLTPRPGRFVYTVWKGERIVQDDAWKLTVLASKEPPRLVKMADDPAERRDRTDEEPERHAAMLSALRESSRGADEVEQKILETLEQLRAIGYVQ